MMVTRKTGFPPVTPPASSAVGVQNHVPQTRAEGSYDSFRQTARVNGPGRFRLELVGRLTQEVRVAVTTGDIQELTRQVREREYVPNPSEIAARMLLMGEGV